MLPPDPRRRAKMNSAKPKRSILSVTLGQLPPGFIAVRCADCDHRDALDVVTVRDRVGPDTAVSDLGRRFRCRECRGPATSIDWTNFIAGRDPPAGIPRQTHRLWPGDRLAQD